MIDLYKALRLSQAASIKQIEKAIHKCTDEELQLRAKTILLDSDKKFIYDRDLVHLIQLSKVHRYLGLSRPSRVDESLYRISRPLSILNKLKKSSWTSNLKFFLGTMAIGAIGIYYFFLVHLT